MCGDKAPQPQIRICFLRPSFPSQQGQGRGGRVFSMMLPTAAAGKEDQRPPRPGWKWGEGLSPRQEGEGTCGKGGLLSLATSRLGLNHVAVLPLAAAFSTLALFSGPRGDLPTRHVGVNQCRGNF